tara:strand:- start:417 stop:977 length:561 start_codon:yes stop_codon:yes gene_type:complete
MKINPLSDSVLYEGASFSEWTTLNDTIMGGKSSSICNADNEGLLLSGNLIEDGGGFVSCRSPYIKPSLNLKNFSKFKLIVQGEGRTLKFAVNCDDRLFGITELMSGGIKWISSFPTKPNGLTIVNIPFDSLIPTIRAKKVKAPVKFNPLAVNRLQLLYSKFGEPGELNNCFKPGLIKILIKEISLE